jgi:hypothetical protein
MKKLTLITLGMLLVSASALADHTSGLKAHQAGQHTYGTHVAGGSVGIVTPKAGLYVNQSSARQPNIVTDPVSCVEKWGDACLETDGSVETPTLDLGEISVSDQIVPVEEGESIESILDSVKDKPKPEATTE